MAEVANELAQPVWFTRALAHPVESHTIDVDGCAIHYLHWRPLQTMNTLAQGQKPPSVLFVHGGLAHAHWWQHVAPSICEDGFECVALSMSGHGNSGTRSWYGQGVWSSEVASVAAAAGLLDADRAARPVLVGHSLGSHVVEEAVFERGASLAAGMVILDGGLPHPTYWLAAADDVHAPSGQSEQPPPEPNAPQRYGRRFRLSERRPRDALRLTPLQPGVPDYVVEHIANHSVKVWRTEEGSLTDFFTKSHALEWAWKVDPTAFQKIDFSHFCFEIGLPSRVLAVDDVRVAVVFGELSRIVTPASQQYMRATLGADISVVTIPDAGHHCFLDQPLACIAALRVLLSEWSRSQVTTGTGAVLPRMMARATNSEYDGDESAMRERIVAEVDGLLGPPVRSKL